MRGEPQGVRSDARTLCPDRADTLSETAKYLSGQQSDTSGKQPDALSEIVSKSLKTLPDTLSGSRFLPVPL